MWIVDKICEMDLLSLYVCLCLVHAMPKETFEMPKWAEIMRKYVRFGLIGHDPDSTMTARGSSNQQPGPGAGAKAKNIK